MKKLLLLVSIVFVSAIGYNQYFVEDFENGGVFPTSWGLSNGTDDWDIDQGNDFGPGSAQSGTYSAFFNDYDYSSGVTADMISPSIDLTSASAPELKFWYHDGNGSDVVEVLVSTDSTTFTSVYTTQGTVSPWTEIVVDLTAYAGNATVHIAFRGLSVYGSTNPHVDNIVVAEAPTCPVPSLFASFGETSITTNLGWVAGGSETEWQVEYGAAGYTFGTGTVLPALDDTLNVTGLTAETTYDFYLRAVCAVGDTSALVGPISLTTPCGAQALPYLEEYTAYVPNCWDEATGGLTANSNLTYGSSLWTSDGFGNVGSAGSARIEIWSNNKDEWLISPTFDLGTGATPYQVEFDIAMTVWNSTAADTLQADDTLALVISTDNGATWSNANILFTWKDGVEPSATGDRVIFNLSAYTGEVKLGFYAGSTVSGEDVNVYIDNFVVREVPSCPTPTALDAFDIAPDSAVLGFIAGASDSSYIIEYGVAGFTSGTGTFINGVEDTVSVNGLMESTTYEYYVRSICTIGDTSELVGPFSFSTPNSCPAATAFNDDFINADSTLLRWTAGASDSSYIIEYGVTGFTPGSGMFVSGTGDSAAINGLMGATEYEFYLRTICTAGDTSLVVGPITVTTACPASFVPTYTEDFTTFTPDCWTEATGTLTSSATLTGTTSQWVADGFANNGFTGAARMEIWSTGRDEWLITPTFDLGNGSVPYQVEFDVALTVWNSSNADTLQADDTLALVISTDNGATWSTTNIINTWDDGNEPSATGDRVVFNLSAYTGLVKLGFYAASTVSGEDVNVYIDNFLIREIPSCPELDSIVAYNVESMQVDVTWKQGAADNSWVIEFDTANFALGTGNTIIATNDTTTILGLLPLTSYDVYVRNVCAVGDSGLWQGPVTFTTPADCPDPNTISDFLLARDSNNITWIGGVADSSYFIEWDTAGFTLGNATSNKFISLEDTVTLTGLTNNTSYDFYVRTLCKTLDTSNWVGPFNFTTVESCPVLTAINSFNVDRDSLSLTWTAGQYDSVWLIEYDTTGFTPGSATSTKLTATTDTVSILSLTPSTTYDFYVRAICTAGDTSVLVGPISATTLCPVIAAPYMQDFDGMTVSSPGFSCYTGDEVDDCWSNDANNNNNWAVLSGATGSGSTGPSADTVSGSGNYLYTEASGCNSELSIVYSPEIDLNALTLPQVSFFYHMFGADMGQLEVFASNDRGATWTSVWTLAGNQGDMWNKAEVVLSSYIGDTVTIKWEGTTGADFESDMAIDAVSFEEAPACPKVSAISFFGTTSDSTNIVYTPGFNDSAWFIEYGLTGFMPGTGNIITVTNDTVGIGGLLENTSFDFYVNSICSVSGDTSGYVGPISVKTLCNVIVNLPYTETFDDSSSTESCWTVLDNNNDGDAWDLDYTTNPFAGDEVAVINTDFNSGANDDYLISPAVLLNGNQRIRFQTRAQSAGEPNDYEIVVSSTGKNAIDFATVIGSETISSTTYDEKIYNLTGLTGNYFIAVKIPAGGLDGWRLYVDDFTIEDIPSCPKPLNLRAYNTGSDSTLVTWDGSANDSVFIVEYGVVGFTPGAGTIVNSLNDTLVLSGLMSNTEYDFYVRSVCGVGDSAVVVAPGTFKTECSAFIAPYIESFNLAILPDCWSEAGDNTWEFGSNATTPTGFADYGADNAPDYTLGAPGTFIGMDGSNNGNGDVSSLISPLVDVTPLAVPALVYGVFSNNVDDNAQNKLIVEFYDGANWSVVDSIQDNLGNSWNERAIDLSSYTISGLTQVRFTITGDNSAGGFTFNNDILIDDVQLTELPTCPRPSQLSASLPGTDTINLTWVAGLNDSSWVVEYGPIGYTVGSGTEVSVGNDTVTLTGLTPDTPYDFYVRGVCTAGDSSIWIGPATDSTLPTCPVPTNLVVNNPTTSTLDVTWTAGINDVSWMLEYGPKGFTQGTGTVIPAASTFQQLTMLAADVEYDVYVRGICGAGDSSRWVGPSSDTTLPTCLRVQSFTQLTADSVSINVGWNLDPSQTGFVLEFGPKGFTLGSGTSVTLGALDNFYQATGLNPLTEYDFYIRAYCANGDSSIFDGPFTFITDCPSSLGVPYTQDFSTYVPECWDEATGRLSTSTTLTTGNSNWSADGFANNGTTGAVRMNIFGTGADEWLITPTFDLGTDAAKAYLVEFDVALTDYLNSNAPDNGNFGEDDTLALVISRDNGVTWSSNDILVLMDTGNIPSVTGNRVSYILTNTTGLVKFGFYAASSVSNEDNDAHIDNFSIQDTAAPVGVAEETAVLSQFKVYPNPNNGNFTLLNEGNSLNTSVTVMDVQGRTVYSNTMFFGQGARKGVSLENTESGIYFLVIENNGRRELHRVVIE